MDDVLNQAFATRIFYSGREELTLLCLKELHFPDLQQGAVKLGDGHLGAHI